MNRQEIEEIKKKPTPKYDAVAKEARWVTDRVVKFATKYPDYEDYNLTPKHLLWKAQVDYQRSLAPYAYARRSYYQFFNNLFYQATKDRKLTDKQERKIAEKYGKMARVYTSIRNAISDLTYQYNPCGCKNCHDQFSVYDFTPRMPFLCPRCRKRVNMWKRSEKWLLHGGQISRDEYEMRLKAGCPDNYLRPVGWKNPETYEEVDRISDESESDFLKKKWTCWYCEHNQHDKCESRQKVYKVTCSCQCRLHTDLTKFQ